MIIILKLIKQLSFDGLGSGAISPSAIHPTISHQKKFTFLLF